MVASEVYRNTAGRVLIEPIAQSMKARGYSGSVHRCNVGATILSCPLGRNTTQLSGSFFKCQNGEYRGFLGRNAETRVLA